MAREWIFHNDGHIGHLPHNLHRMLCGRDIWPGDAERKPAARRTHARECKSCLRVAEVWRLTIPPFEWD